MAYDYKHVFKLSDFVDAAQYAYTKYDELNEEIDKFLTKKIDNYYAGNPFIELFVYGSKFDNGALSYGDLITEYNIGLQILPNYNIDLTPDLLVLKEFTLPLFNYLNNVFISVDTVTANVVWWYSYDIDKSKITNDAILSSNITSGLFYKNTSEMFNRIYISGDLSDITVKDFFIKNFNFKTSDIVECGLYQVNGESFTYVNGNSSSFVNEITLKSDYISITNKEAVTELLNEDNVNSFIKRDLSNINMFYVNCESVENETDNTILSINAIEKENEFLKDANDYNVDSGFVIENSYSGQDVLTSRKAVSIIKTHIEDFYIQIINDIINDKPTTDIGKMIDYYKTKIDELESNYLFLKNHSLSSFYNRDDFCLEKTNPITFVKQPKCVDANVSIEVSNKALTKGVFKRWMIQCINDRIPI